jgi:Zn-dependent protease
LRRHNIPLGKVLGIQIGLDYTWFLIFALFTWTLAVSYFPAQFKNWSTAQYWIIGAATSIIFFISVLLHELGHSVVALGYKINVKRITLFIFGGLAEIEGEPPKASAEFWIAIAGPIVSFILAGVFYLIKNLFVSTGAMAGLFEYLAYINFVLALFNLIPGFPLDGGRVLRSAVWGYTHNFKRATLISATVGRFFAFIFIFLGVINLFAGNVGDGLWIAFIGWFLESAASAQIQQQVIQDDLAGYKVSEAMGRNFSIIPDDTTVQEVVDNHILGSGRRCLLIKKDESYIGLLTPHRIKNIPPSKRESTPVTEAMIPNIETEKVAADSPMWDALKKMDKDGVNQLPVTEDGEIIGIIDRESILTFIGSLHQSNS